MVSDYRNTRYCPSLKGISDRKNEVVKQVHADYPKAVDIHNYISKNDCKYKIEFIKAYNGKCAYCGVSIAEIPKTHFEIDHYIYQKAPCFKSKKEAGKIENLILACHDCNHNKSSIIIPDSSYQKFYPDGDEISKVFFRDEEYYIKVSPDYCGDQEVSDFYNQLKLGSEIRRLDYLLMNIRGLIGTLPDTAIRDKLGRIANNLQLKRNIGITS